MAVPSIRPCFIAVLLLASASSACSGEASPPPGPPPQHCVRVWNEDSPSVAVPADDANVIVYEWTDKAEDEGCGVVIVSRTTGAWTIHFIVLARAGKALPGTRWDAVSGQEWGEDSPEGDVPEAPNAALNPAGRIISI